MSPGALEAFNQLLEDLLNSETTYGSQGEIAQASQLKKIAETIANGEIPIPIDWAEDELNQLLDLVHVARRKQLLQFFARTVARDICRRDRKLQGGSHATPKI